MEVHLNIGAKATAQTIVTEKNTAIAMQSGNLPVFATPSMTALMESAAASCAQSGLPDELTTVGTALNITHIAATPLNMQVIAEAELLSIEGRKLTFKVTARDEIEPIGEGTHTRFIIDSVKFMNKVNAK